MGQPGAARCTGWPLSNPRQLDVPLRRQAGRETLILARPASQLPDGGGRLTHVSPLEKPVSFEPDWSSADELPLIPVNQYVTQVGPGAGPMGVPDGIYLTLGTASPPIFVGDPERVREQLESHGNRVRVSAIVRVVLTRQRAEELAEMLTIAARQFDVALEAGAHRGASND